LGPFLLGSLAQEYLEKTLKQLFSFLFQHSCCSLLAEHDHVAGRALEAGQMPASINCTAIEYDGPSFGMEDITDPCFVLPPNCPPLSPYMCQPLAVAVSLFSCGVIRTTAFLIKGHRQDPNTLRAPFWSSKHELGVVGGFAVPMIRLCESFLKVSCCNLKHCRL